jgi:precorrin-4/cobalt-precorrin-4 C11-methyltransferase
VPGVAQTVVLTRTSARSTPMPPGEQLAAYAATGATLVLHLAVQRIDVLAPELAAHYGEDCPVAVVARAGRADELVLRGTLAGIAAQVTAAGVRRTAVVVVGRALTAEQFPDSHLYSTTRPRA